MYHSWDCRICYNPYENDGHKFFYKSKVQNWAGFIKRKNCIYHHCIDERFANILDDISRMNINYTDKHWHEILYDYYDGDSKQMYKESKWNEYSCDTTNRHHRVYFSLGQDMEFQELPWPGYLYDFLIDDMIEDKKIKSDIR